MCEHMASGWFRTRHPKQPRKQILACVSPANGLCGLVPVPGVVACADAPRSCELSPGHALGPSARSRRRLSPHRSRTAVLYLAQGPASQRPSASRCHVTKTIATRPLPERDGGDDSSPIEKVKNKKGTSANYF